MEFGPPGESVSPPVSIPVPAQVVQFIGTPSAPPMPIVPPAQIAQIPMPLQQSPRRQWLRTSWASALLTSLILLVISAAGLLSYTAVVRPVMLNAQATTVAQTFLTAQAQNNSPQYIYQYATRGKPTINDPLDNEKTSVWNQETPPENSCVFVSGAYHILVGSQNSYATCFSNLKLANFALQVQVTILVGNGVGILFRTVPPLQRFYLFSIIRGGIYAFERISDPILTSKVLAFKSSSAINTGENQANLLTIIALNNRFYLYINRQAVGQFTDNAYSAGTLSLRAFSGSYPTADVAFSNLQIWEL